MDPVGFGWQLAAAGGSAGATVGLGVGGVPAGAVVVDPDVPRSPEPSSLQSVWGPSMMRTSGGARLPRRRGLASVMGMWLLQCKL